MNAELGKDLISGQELVTGERLFREITGAVSFGMGVKGLMSFSKSVTLVKGASSTKMEHVVKMAQNSVRANFKDIINKADTIKKLNSLPEITKKLETITDPNKKAEFFTRRIYWKKQINILCRKN